MFLRNTIVQYLKRFCSSEPTYIDPVIENVPKSLYEKVLRRGIELTEQHDESYYQFKFLFPDYKQKVNIKRIVTENDRCGAYGIKIGMSNLWLEHNCRYVTCTMIHIKECEVLHHIKPYQTLTGYSPNVLIVGGKNVDEDRYHELHVRAQEFYHNINKRPKAIMGGFRVHEKNVLPVGTEITAAHFVPGQKIKVIGKTKDHGFQGVVKRYKFKGGPATHGCTKSHRRRGNTGCERGVVLPGTRMPGHMGLKMRTQGSLHLLRINTVHNILYIQGCIPGVTGDYVKLSDTRFHKANLKIEFPSPTFMGDINELEEDIYSPWVHPLHLPWSPPKV